MQPRLSRKQSLGFGLVEIMVAMLIGMFGVLIMMQVLNVSEEQKRTTTSGNDAMNEGVLALYTLQTDIRSAGYGITDPLILGCSLQLRAGLTLPALAPVAVNSALVPAGDANTDTLLVFTTNNYGTPQGDKVIGAGGVMQTFPSFAVNDWVVVSNAVRPSPCALTLERISALNVTTSAITLASGTTVNKDSLVFNFGQSFRATGYAIRSGNLTTCDFTNTAVDCTNAASWIAINSNIASLRVQYGRDVTAPSMDGRIDQYDQVAPASMCDWSRISAVRLALTARSAQMEKTAVTAGAPVWEGSTAGNPTGSAATAINLTGDANWTFYRYRVFQTVAPMRNLAWAGVVSGC